MNLIKKITSFAALMFVCSILVSASLTSCDTKAKEEATEESAGEDKKEAEHPKGESEHPAKDADSTKVEEPNQ